jgi:hypothetical protein
MARTNLPRTVWCGEGRKVFFSEEKKQKTLDFSGVCAACPARRVGRRRRAKRNVRDSIE